MRISKNVSIVIVGVLLLVVLIVVAWWLPRHRTVTNSNATVSGTNADVAQQELQRDVNALVNAHWKGITEDRIELLGSSLIDVPDGALAQQLSADAKLKVHVTYAEGMTSREGIRRTTEILSSRPPLYLVIDLGRYDAVNGIPLNETIANISLIASEAFSEGVHPIVLGGIGSDGSISLASSLAPSIQTAGSFIDVTPLLIDPLLRASPTELNADGVQKMSRLISQKILKQP